MPYYAFGAGLLTPNYQLSQFGVHVLESDPLMELQSTQWLMHYYMSAPSGPGPLFWHGLVCKRLRPGGEFSSTEAEVDIANIQTESRGRTLSTRSIESARTAFTNTYLNDDGLGRLGVLASPSRGRYLVQEPDPPSPWVFGLALLDYWRAAYGENRLTINLDDLSAPGALGDIFLIGGGRINQLLRVLEDAGFVQLYRFAPPYQVVLLQTDPQPLLERLYDHDPAA